MLPGPYPPPGSARGVAAVAIMAVPVLRGRARGPPPAGVCARVPADPHRLPFLPVPGLDETPGPGMMETGARQQTHAL